MSIKPSHVSFSTREYESDHGSKPRGIGNWAFCAVEHARKDDYISHVKWFHASYGFAKRAAAQAFAAEGVSDVVVCS